MTAPATPAQLSASREFMVAADRLVPLYQLSEEFTRLVMLLEDPEQDAKAVDAELERVAADIKAKAYGIAVVIQSIENKAAVLKLEEQRLNTKRKACESASERLRAYTLAHFKELGIERLDYGTFTLSVRANPGRVEVTNAAEVPMEFNKVTITTTVDKKLVMDTFKRDGLLVPGTEIVKSDRLELR